MKARLLFALWLLASLSALPVHAATPMVATGGAHTVALKSDGSVAAWGSDSAGQLGLGRVIRSAVPVKVAGLDSVIAVSAGSNHTVALKSDGTVWAWGWNEYFQLGDGSNVDRSAPVQAKGLSGITAIAAGDRYTLALKNDGTVWVWGYNNVNQASYGYLKTPQLVSGLTGVSAIAAGRASYALKGGTVWAWGDNTNGQAGNGSVGGQQTTPAQVQGLTGVSAISAASGADQVLALKTDETVWAWGANGYGQLGDGTTIDRGVPVRVTGLTGVKSIYSSDRSAFALTQNGSLWAWGWNYYGQLGDGSATDRSSPVPISSQTGVTGVATGGYAFGIYTLALRQDASVAQWGWSSADLSTLTSVLAISVGGNHSAVLNADHTVWTWGENDRGQLGDGATVVKTVPVAVPGVSGISSVAAGWDHTLALKEDGTVWSWGGNLNGQLGSGTNSARSAAAQISGLSNVIAISAGFGSSLALTSNGTVWGWGSIGDGSQHSTPVQLPVLSGIQAIASGLNHMLALKQSDGTVWAWGDNSSGQLGDGSLTSRGTPAQVNGLIGVTAIAAGGDNSFALKSDQTVWGWGNNAIGQVGDGASVNRSTPVQVQGLTTVQAIAAGGADGHALKQDGTVWSWGENWPGKLGDGTATNRSTPVQTLRLNSIGMIAAGNEHAVAVKQDGSVWVWGNNGSGQLGDGTFAQRRSAVLATNETADGFLNLIPGTTFQVPPEVGVPFFVVSTGGVTSTSASVKTNTKFSGASAGKQGEVYVTAMVPDGTLTALQSSSPMRSGSALMATSAATPSYVLIQLTPTGWQQVTNGQLIPYASGVLNEQLAAQNILDGTDTTNLPGAQFCVGYGTSAADMVGSGNMRTVATIPDQNATSTATSCVVPADALSTTTTTTTSTTTTSTTTATTTTDAATTTTASTTTTTLAGGGGVTLNFAAGWNLVGNGLGGVLDVVAAFGDSTNVTTVWKWVTSKLGWAFYSPDQSDGGAAYAIGKGYDFLASINGGEGFWVNAKNAFSVQLPAGATISTPYFQTMPTGWNLIALGETVTPSQFNTGLGFDVVTLWAWDNSSSSWYFYAPSLEAQGGTVLSGYITNKGYIDFGATGKHLGPGVGFWVNR